MGESIKRKSDDIPGSIPWERLWVYTYCAVIIGVAVLHSLKIIFIGI